MARKRVTVTDESSTGQDMTRSQFVREIDSGNYDRYHVSEINGVKTPVSNPDGSENNNLG